ncbi:A-kinase anchor protein 9 isoform X2 [Hyla sarda]|uniref:A-kinase anchor protein 9 isoform X2 n=1 Tax=Hyla sarda TaxID=327740 RepID=UPI0024C447C5|nr:A-kinase anchor protein 9 isoform X2 [Hyla sarda]
MSKRRCVELKICQTIRCSTPVYRRQKLRASSKGAGMDEEEQERKRKLEAGKAKLAQFRQRKGQSDSQNTAKKNKKKKTSSGSKQHDKSDLVSEAGLSQSNDAPSQTTPSGAATTAEFTIMRTLPQGEIIQHDKTYTIEPESEVSTTADDYSSEVVDDLFPLPANNTTHILWEEEFGVRETFSERGTQSSQTRLEVMEDELAGKQQEIEELNRELEEMRAAYGNEGLQQLQEFETAIKQRDGIITQLTSNLQQARKEKDDIMREFLELTEQSQKLKIQFQHLQAGETLRNTSHSSTAADLLHTRQQILSYQQQVEERDQHLGRFQKENEHLRAQVTSLQDQIHSLHQEQQRELESSYEQRLNEKDLVVDSLKSALHNEEIKCTELEERIYAAEKSVDELREELTQKSQEINSLSEELNTSKQRERRSSDEIKQLMGTVEDLQKKHHKDSQSEADLAQRMESETQRKLEQLQAELDEMYGQQIVQMKQELVRQHTLEIQRLLDQHKLELDNVSRQTSINVTSERINELNAVISELNAKLQESDEHRKKMKEDLSKKLHIASSEKSHLQKQIEDLLQDLSFAREQIQKVKQSLTEKENQLNEANSFLTTIDDLKAEVVAAKEFTKELESKHEAEVTNYKIKLEMLEREKDAVLDRMAESQEAELEKLRTYFLFSQEEDLAKMREELNREHRTNIENLKDNLEMQYKSQIEQIQHELNQTITAMQSEKDSLITKQNNLVLEVSKLKDLPQCVYDPRSEEMMVQINELQKELECLRREEKEKGSMEQEVQVLQLRIKVLEKEVEDKDALKKKLIVLEADNRLLRDENDALQNTTKDCNTENCDKFTELANLDLKNQIEVLSSENESLRNLELRLREEIEQQKNTFSFAEKNFEVNYHELKDEYTFLVKEKEQLEDSKSKMEEDFRIRLQALGDELAKFKGNTMGEPRLGAAKSIKVDRLDVGDVVEKDTTELMEKLEIAQRDKEELSLKLSGLSEELQLKQNEINQLKEKVEALVLGRDHDTTEDESCLKDNVPIEVNSHILTSSDGVDTRKLEESIHPIESPPLHVSPQVSHFQKELQDALMEKESLLQRVHELSGKLEAETSLVEIAQLEKDELQRKVEAAVQEQTDLMLQLEAQRISLTQIHKAHVELMGENFRAEREQELCSLRDSLLASQEQKIRELQELHQQERLSRPPPQQTVSDPETCQDLTGMLMKRIQEECDRINQALSERMTDEKDTTPDAETMSNLTDSKLLEQHRAAVQTLHSNLDALLGRFLEEYKQMRELSSCMEKTGDRQATKEEIEIPAVTHIVIRSQNSAASPSGAQEVLVPSVSPSQEIERLKIEFSQQRAHLEDKHAQEIQHLRSYFQQQLKENEDRFSTEIIHLLEKLQDVTAGSLESREISRGESTSELGFEEAAIFQSIVAPSTDALKMDGATQMEDHSLRQPFGPIYQQLQSLRQALYSKYVEEVNALKKRHEEELDQLRAELTAEHNKENAALNQQIIHLTKAKQEILNGSFQEPALYPILEEKDPEDLNQLVEERFRERIEEEVARVIVEMSIAFAQQTELARLAVLKDEEISELRESPGEQSEMPAEEADLDGEKLQGVTSVEASLVTEVRDIAKSTVSHTTQQTKEITPEHHDGSQPADPNTKEKTVVLKEEDYNQMVAMGAESAKYKQMFEEKVEDMRQELVRQEQEYQQAAEALRLAHTAQLERQMYDQEQLLLEVHRLRAQLAENASAVTEIQATDREKMLLEELESMKLTCAEVTAMARARPLQDSSSQTQQDEDLPQTESNEEPRESEAGDEESPADDAGGDRKNLKRTNKHLLKILLEVVKTTGAVEETIGRHVMGLLDKSGRRQSTSKVHAWSAETEHLEAVSPAAITVTAGPDEIGAGEEGASIWSAAVVEELDVPLQLTEEGLSGTDLSPEDEAPILNVSIRLQAAVEKLLEAINDTSNQLAHAKVAQTELVRESLKRKQETTELLRCQEELHERLNEEAKVREHLALELSKAEGLLDGYTDERVFLEKQMQEKIELIRHLELELQSTGNRLQELEQERQQIQEEKELLSRQKLALKAEAAPAEQQLLEETEKLLKEKIEVQRQAEKDSGDLHKQVKVLEVELEEQVNRYMEMEQEKNADLEDLRQKNFSLEKQLEKTRRFLDEQAVDREHERDVFQQEIQKLEQQLKMPQRHQPVADHQNNEVEKLESNLKEKTDKCSELLLCKEQLQRDVQERNEELEKLEGRIRELEQALIISTDGLQKAEDRRPSIVVGLKGEMPLEAQLQVEREAIDRKEKEITNLVEQLEQFREELENKNEEVQQLHMQLEIQSKESDTRLQELEQENKVLKDEAISTQHEHPRAFSSSKVPQPKTGKNEELLLLKDQEIDLLNEQIGRLQAQLESATDNKVIEEKNEQIKEYKSQIKCLKSDQEQLKKNSEEEIEKLNEVIEKLQEELSHIEQKVAVDFADKHQYEDMADRKDILQPLVGHGEAPFTNMEEENLDASKPLVNNMAVECKNTYNTDIRNDISSKLMSEQEDVQVTLQNMESKLKELMDVIKKKDEQIVMLEKQNLVVKDVNEMDSNTALEHGNISNTDRGNENSTVPSNPLSEPEDMQVTLKDMEAKLKELKDIIEEKNEQIVILQKQTLIMKDLEETVQRLQTELEERDQKSTEMQSSGHPLGPIGPEKPVLPPNTEESNIDETLSNKEMVTKKFEIQQLEEVSGKSISSENLVKKDGNDTVNIERLSEELREKTAQYLAAEALLISVQEASKEAIHQLEIQLQDLRTAIHEKDSQILQLTNASPLPENQEIERLNDVIRDLQDKLTDAEEKIKEAREGQRETLLENTEILLEKLDQDDSELASMKVELQKTKMEMGLLEKELEKYKLLHETIKPKKDEYKTIETSIVEAPVTYVEQALPTKASEPPGATQDMFTSTEETTITIMKNMESQIQELQSVIHLKDEELLKYANQKDLLDQQMKEIEQLNNRLQDTKKVKRDISDATRKDGESQESDGETITENKEVQKNSALEKELEETKMAMALLKEKLEKVKDINTKDGVSQTYHQESLTENEENVLQKVGEDDGKVLPIIAKLEKTRMEMDLLEEKMANVKLFQGSEDVKESDEGNKDGRQGGTLKPSKSGKAAISQEKQVVLTFTNTPKDMELHIQQLQNIISLKDAELMEWTNQKDLLKRQAQEIEQLKAELREDRKDSMDSGATTKDGESQTSHKTITTENREVQKDYDRDNILQAELQATKMEVATLKEELEQLKESKQIEASSEENVHKTKRDKRDTEEAEKEKQAEPSQTIETSTETTKNVIHNVESRLQDVKVEETSSLVETNKSKLDKRDTEAAEREQQAERSHAMETCTEETTQNVIQNMESRLQELQNVIQQKDLELQQYLNQQNLVSQQTMEIERLQDVIETLKHKLEVAELMKSSIIKTEGEEQVRDKEKKVRHLMNGETTDTNSHDTSVDVRQDSRQMLKGKDNIDGQDPSQGKSSGDETYDSGVDGTLRERTAQHLANQVLLTSVQETMQNTIDTMESQLQEMQQVIKEKDLEMLLYLEEIKTLKEHVIAESDQHGQMMGALEDTLREKVAAALVSDAQLKAIQVHTKKLQDDDRPFTLEEEARTLQDLGGKPSAEEEAESKLSSLSLRLLELEKQLSDLHEQLQVERQQVHIANEKAAEKERQLCELQKILESSWGNKDINWVKSEADNADAARSQRIVIQSEDNTATDLENVLQSVKAEATATKEELCHYREVAEKQREELMVKESNLAHLEEDLLDVRRCLAHAEEKLASYMKKELQEEEQRQTMSGVDFTDGARSPGWSGRERSTSSSSQTDVVPSVNTSNQTVRVHHKNIGVQKELESARLGNTSEEVAELMERYTDKISQMQELHAAEILDMEARHIGEADALRREQYTVVQALTNECDALKAVIEALKSSGGVVPDAALSPSYHLTDAASSECDWSQGTYDAQSLDQLPEGLRVEDDVPAELIPSKIKDLLRAVHQEGMQVLSLTEATSPEKEKTFTLNTQSWREERKTLLETIASLKDLIAKMQLYKEPEIHTRVDFHERTPDWRGELLRAIKEVFCREQDALLSAYHTQLSTLGNCDPTALLNQMQHRLQEQGIEQINSMDCIQNAERRSLLLEIQDLRAKLTSLQIDRHIDPLHHTEGTSLYLPQDQSSLLQDQSSLLQDQSSLLQDQSSLPQEMHLQLHSMKANAGELQDQLSSERLLSEEIKNELALTKMELESTVKLQHKHFKELESLRIELKKRREELDSANDALANEQKKTRELQWSLEKEKTRAERDEQHEKEELEDLQILLEEQKTKTLEISKRLEEEQLLVKSLQEQLASKESLHDSALSVERSRVSELQAFLDAEKTRSGELANTLERRQGLADSIENTDGSGQQEGHNQTEELLRDLQGQLDTKHHRIVELVSEAEGYKLECVQLRQSLDEERQRLRKELETEKETASIAKKQVEELRSVMEELQKQIQDRVKEIRGLQTEEKRLKETIQSLQNSGRTKESGSEKAELPGSSATSKASIEPSRSEPCQPTGSIPNVLCPDPLSLVDGDPEADEAASSIDTIRRKLLQVSSKLTQLAAKTTRRVMFNATDDDDFAWSQNAIQEVMSQLELLTVLSLQGQNLVLPSGISANTLTEKLLTQNAELTGYVSRLTNEKNDLQKTLLRLEGEISHHRAREGSGDHSPQSTWDHTTTLDSFTEERETWNREKLNLHKALNQMEAELSKVKAELRNESLQRDIGRDTDNAALKRVYGKYLRSESFRKALVYQKKYLLLLLGGFQECEEATLALIARMGGQPSFTDLEVITKHSRAFTRFRSAARVAIAISRMRFLVRRWQRAISPVGGTADRNGFGLNIGNEVRTDSPYHPAGSVDMYGDQRLSCRSRSGFDSPQSTVNSQHRYASSDLSSCSHLQNYDPDRALTDYIARLEALQKRLGNAPSASNTNSTTHYSIRR